MRATGLFTSRVVMNVALSLVAVAAVSLPVAALPPGRMPIQANTEAAGSPKNLLRATVETITVTGDFATRLGQLAKGAAAGGEGSSDGAVWLGYQVAKQPGTGESCCWHGVRFTNGRADGDLGRRGCNLDRRGKFLADLDDGSARTAAHDAGPAAITLDDDDRALMMFLKVDRAGEVQQLRSMSADCPVDAGGRRVLWLGAQPAAPSVDLLGGLVAAAEASVAAEDLAEEALGALAQHAGGEADRALTSLARQGPRELRQEVWFWVGHARGAAGFAVLSELLPRLPSADREEITFAFSQSPVPAAQETLFRLARRDPDADVRGQALFWLAQKNAPGVVELIRETLRRSGGEDDVEKAVFALSQLPDEQGTVELLAVLRDGKLDAGVRQQALFWLGQSDDPRAEQAIDEILLRN